MHHVLRQFERFTKRLARCTEQLADVLFPPRDRQVLVRHATYEQLARLLRKYIIEIDGMEIHTLLPYRNQLVSALLLEAKFNASSKAQKFLGQALRAYLNTYIKVSSIVLVPIPLGKKRLKERGYNQVEEIARYSVDSSANSAGRSAKITLSPHLLTRTRNTTSQMTLDRNARLLNMHDAFEVPASHQPLNPSCIYVLLDDVVTTGATLLAARDALLQAGATQIVVLALAH